jgi:hypothetical protein
VGRRSDSNARRWRDITGQRRARGGGSAADRQSLPPPTARSWDLHRRKTLERERRPARRPAAPARRRWTTERRRALEARRVRRRARRSASIASRSSRERRFRADATGKKHRHRGSARVRVDRARASVAAASTPESATRADGGIATRRSGGALGPARARSPRRGAPASEAGARGDGRHRGDRAAGRRIAGVGRSSRDARPRGGSGGVLCRTRTLRNFTMVPSLSFTCVRRVSKRAMRARQQRLSTRSFTEGFFCGEKSASHHMGPQF